MQRKATTSLYLVEILMSVREVVRERAREAERDKVAQVNNGG